MKEQLKVIPFFNELNDKDKEKVDLHTSIKEYKKRDIILDFDDEDVSGAIILEGRARVYSLLSTGREITMFNLSAQDPFYVSPSALTDKETINITISAETPAKVLLLKTKAIETLLCNINFKMRCYDNILNKCMDIFRKNEANASSSLDKRIALFLLDNCDSKDAVWNTQEEIAQKINSVREVVTKKLAIMKADDTITIKRGRIIINDKNKLKNITISD